MIDYVEGRHFEVGGVLDDDGDLTEEEEGGGHEDYDSEGKELH